MLLIVEKGTRGGICHAIHRYAKANNKYMKNYDKNITSSHIITTNNLHGWGMSQKLPVNGFKWVKKLLFLMRTSEKSMVKIVIRDKFLKQMLNMQKIYSIFIRIFQFKLKE